MRKYVFALMVLSFAVVACNKTETTTPASTDQLTVVSDIPLAIAIYIAENYPDASIATTLKMSTSDTAYVITLNTAEILAFDHNGKHMGGGSHFCPGDSTWFPGGDTTWVPGDTTMPGGGGHHGGGHHGGGHHGGGHPGGGHPGGGVSLDSLNAAIIDYVAANYAGFTIRHAEIDTMCQFGAVTEVMISLDSLPPVKLLFDASGIYLAKGERILYADIPASVTDAIAAAYAGYTARSKAEMFTLADNSVQYKVFLHMTNLKVKVVVNVDGTVVCEE